MLFDFVVSWCITFGVFVTVIYMIYISLNYSSCMRRRWSHKSQLPHLRGQSRWRLEKRLARSFPPLTTLVHPILHGSILQELLKDAAKATVRRLCTVKKTRVGLNVPQWVIDEYQKRPKGETAELLMKVNFDKARYGITHIWSESLNPWYIGCPFI